MAIVDIIVVNSSIGIIALDNGNKNMEGTIEAAYEAIIPAFKNFEAANMAKVQYSYAGGEIFVQLHA